VVDAAGGAARGAARARPSGEGYAPVMATRDELLAATRDFTEAFNRNDLDGVMAWFSDDIAYEQFDGRVAEGREAVRAAFEPQFAGAFGRMWFDEEDCFVDPAAGRALITWVCGTARGDRARAWQGLDILHFDEAGRICRKLTYGKAERLAVHPVALPAPLA
jgi:ketosteroid isomerase-like protein